MKSLRRLREWMEDRYTLCGRPGIRRAIGKSNAHLRHRSKAAKHRASRRNNGCN